MSTRTTHGITLALGIGIGLLVSLFTSTNGCVPIPYPPNPDTVIVRMPIVIPTRPEIRYRTLKEVSHQVDTFVLIREIARLDSFLRVDSVDRVMSSFKKENQLLQMLDKIDTYC